MPIDHANLRDVLIAVAVALAILLLPRLAHAYGPLIVYDPSNFVVNSSQLTQDTLIAASVDTPGGAGRFQPQADYLNALMQTMATGVADAGTFASLYPGWVDFGPNAAFEAAQITNTTLTTYANAMTVAQSQAADFNTEDAHFESLEACNAASIGVLQAIQCGNEISLAAAQQTQMERQLLITLIMVEAVDHGEQLNEKAQTGANNEVSQLTAAQQ